MTVMKSPRISDFGNPPVEVVKVQPKKIRIRTSLIVVDEDLKILETDNSFRDIYGFDERFVAATLVDVVAERVKLGWVGLSEAISPGDPVKVRVDEVLGTDNHQTYQCSGDGKIVRVTHLRDRDSGRTYIFVSETCFRSSSDKYIENKALPFCILISEDELNRDSLDQRPLFERRGCDGPLARAIFLDEGRLAFFAKDASDPGPRYPFSSLDEIGIELDEVLEVLEQEESFVYVNSSLYAETKVVIRIWREVTFTGGPQFFKCTIESLGIGLSSRNISVYFPTFSEREAEVVSLLAQGLTIKEAARKMDRAQGTVTIQARSAMQKAGVNSLVSLVSLVCQVCCCCERKGGTFGTIEYRSRANS